MPAYAVDVGYGFTKAISDRGNKICLPSVVAPARADLLDGLFATAGAHNYRVWLKQNDQEAEYLVGEAAMRSLAAASTLAREKPPEIHDLLTLTAIYLTSSDDEDILPRTSALAIGLPLSFYAKQKDLLRVRMQSLSAALQINSGPEKQIKISRAVVFPQGAGLVFSEAPALPRNGLVGIVDVGTYTTDYLLIEIKSGQPLPVLDACGSVEAGVYLVHRAIAAAFQNATGAPLPPEMVHMVMAKIENGETIKYNNSELDLREVYSKALKDTALIITQKVLAAWGNQAGFVEQTLLAGGGALLFKDELLCSFPYSRLVDDPIYANVRGYLAAIG